MKKIFIVCLVMVISVSLCSCGTPNDIIKGTGADVINSEASISLEEFNKIETGMTYQQVCDIIGGEGTLGSSVDVGIGEEYKTEIYQWTGDGSIGANANVSFQGGKVVSKAQMGLK
ncbi:MAG: hypothetical protein U0M42_09695 [Acutalibacteraceae bacterium]|nr:hypothetical protein [Acutalibacteraceae bacterium]